MFAGPGRHLRIQKSMKQSIFTILENKRLAPSVYRMELVGDTSQITAPGQFVNIRLEGRFLRRPISVCDKAEDRLVLIYKVVGHGTQQLSEMAPGTQLDLLTGLGNGYDLSKCGEKPLLIGGGAGVPPMYWLCRELIALGKEVTVILGFNTAEEVFYEAEFAALGARTIVMTADGSYGRKGFVTDGMTALEKECGFAGKDAQQPDCAGSSADTFYSYIYTCGPMPMFRAINQVARTSGQFSFEERMGCGFGACMGCSCKTITGYKRICKDGPVLEREEILW